MATSWPDLFRPSNVFSITDSKTWMPATSAGMTVTPCGPLYAPSPLHDNRGADPGPVIQIDDVIVGHTNAAGRDVAAEFPGLVGAVDAVKRIAEIERARPERIIRAADHVTRQIGKAPQ